MCGIFGWQWKSHKLPVSETRTIIATALGWQNETRGTDSYGWYDTKSKTMFKSMGDCGDEARHMASLSSVIGHTRHATVGAKTIENAHPFTFGRIVGAHNGAIYNHKELNEERKKTGLKEHEVDSMHLFTELDKGLDISKLRGYGAIEWADSDFPKRIHLCRISSNGDLAVAQTEFGVVWSSDEKHLRRALMLAGVKHQMMKVSAEQVYFVEGGIFYYMKETKLELSSSSYSATPYGSRMYDMYEDDEDYEQTWVDLLMKKAVENNEFPFLTKEERKNLIRKRNLIGKKSYSYKDLCRCGAWATDGEAHERHCDKFEVVKIEKPTSKCKDCHTTDDVHWQWCPKLQTSIVIDNGRPVRKGIFLNADWVCPDCYAKPDVYDQECPNGHGRVLGNVAD